jgi:hypothetical protein
MKKEVAPTVCTVQFISPPSEIVAVETHNAIHANNDNGPIFFNLVSAYPLISKLFISR